MNRIVDRIAYGVGVVMWRAIYAGLIQRSSDATTRMVAPAAFAVDAPTEAHSPLIAA